MAKHHKPLGPRGTWKTGQRVPERDYWVDQYGAGAWFEQGSTFPPCLGRKGECAFWRRWNKAAGTA